jgi:hypothetical protein
MIWLATLAGVGWVVAIVLFLVLPARERRRALQVSLRLRAHVRPYLQIRALEAKLDIPSPSDTHEPDEIVDDLCDLTRKLYDHERSQMELGDTVNVAVSDTMPVGAKDLIEADKE